ncbi:MAG: methyltransferase [Pseudomonadota bacterium]
MRHWCPKPNSNSQIESLSVGALDFSEKYEIRRPLLIIFYLLMVVWSIAVWIETGFSFQPVGIWKSVAIVLTATVGVVLFMLSLLELFSYLFFLPVAGGSVGALSHVHTESLLIPLTASLLFLTLASNILTGSIYGWCLWILLLITLGSITYLALNSQDSAGMSSESTDPTPKTGLISQLLGLILGAEIITVSAGATPISPWRIDKLSHDTWVVDVRTKAEFQWNHLDGADNFPWGIGLYDAALAHSKSQPVLVTCFSGHRSPAVAVMLRKMGFEKVYNLHWGLIYYMILNRGKKQFGHFILTRSSRDTSGRGKDYKAISVAYVVTQVIMLILAPIEKWLTGTQVSVLQRWIGGIIGFSGFVGAFMAYRALGRNFRVFAAPRRSGTLNTGGIYSKVRHPMYTAVICAFLGYVIYWGSGWSVLFWLAMTTLYIIKAWKEEQVLEQRYPGYDDYRKRTWRFLPYIY